MRIPGGRASSSVMFLRLFSASSTVLRRKHSIEGQTLEKALQGRPNNKVLWTGGLTLGSPSHPPQWVLQLCREWCQHCCWGNPALLSVEHSAVHQPSLRVRVSERARERMRTHTHTQAQASTRARKENMKTCKVRQGKKKKNGIYTFQSRQSFPKPVVTILIK